MKLKILHTNDLHSKFEELSRIASAIDELRDENTLVIDAGDNADFSRPETEGTNGKISSALLNEIGYSAKVFGNNEGFAGKHNARIIAQTSNCPVLVCNMLDMKGKRLDFVDDSVVIDLPDFRILTIGVTAPLNVFFHLYGIHASNPEQELRRVLAKNQKVTHDLTILVSHLGLIEDKILASKIPDIDVIVGGHSHTFLEQPLLENKTIICQAGHSGQCLGELIVEFDDSKKVCGFDGRLIQSKKYPENPRINKLISCFKEQAEKNLSSQIYFLRKSLDHSLVEENSIGNLLADALRHLLKADIGIINSGAVDSGISIGPVTKRLLHELSPSPLNPTYMEMKGKDIESALEKSLSKEYQLSDGRGAGFRGSHLGNLQVSSNVRVEVDAESNVTLITVDRKPLEMERWYSVATSDYLQRGTGYLDFARNRNERYRPEFLRDVLEKYVKKQEFRERACRKRFQFEHYSRKK